MKGRKSVPYVNIPNNLPKPQSVSKVSVAAPENYRADLKPANVREEDDKCDKNVSTPSVIRINNAKDKNENLLTYIQALSFEDIWASCKQSNNLFEDVNFPATNSSIFCNCTSKVTVQWQRPSEITKKFNLKPELFASNTDTTLALGNFGDKWVLNAALSLVEDTEGLFTILPRGQSFRDEWYMGAFHFNFFRNGTWEKVTIDDRLPTIDGKLNFIHSFTPNEFWASLLEKAYAKFHGSYEAMKSCSFEETLHHLTGGTVITHNMADLDTTSLDDIIFQSIECNCKILCSIMADGRKWNELLSNGFVAERMYAILDIRGIKLTRDDIVKPVTLVKLKSTDGLRLEWSGAWNSHSPEWRNIRSGDKEKLELTIDNHSETWIEIHDFYKIFTSLYVCYPTANPSTFGSKMLNKVQEFEGQWLNGVTAGGRPTCMDSFWVNPQFEVKVQNSPKGGAFFIVDLIQNDNRLIRHKARINNVVGIALYQVVLNANLAKGTYIVIPSTYDPNQEGEFILRLVYDEENNIEIRQLGDVINVSYDMFNCMPNTTYDLRNKFLELSGEEMKINAFQLATLFCELKLKDFQADVEICKSLLLLSRHTSGYCDFNDFLLIFGILSLLMEIFTSTGKSLNKKITGYELVDLCEKLGHIVPEKFLMESLWKFTDEETRLSCGNFIRFVCFFTSTFSEERNSA
ncbi:DgyrCDS2973 [Dimorphilus gyrociliatus]|uniref:DgyrCDS2973 n=1 Tax=Dimorphilus gyrociliatus TaxID=2664684 RepID=A0A7I8VC01_9ANNE|nr:DgyrCDS2973 [Dimorphilus gyrociliatus]